MLFLLYAAVAACGPFVCPPTSPGAVVAAPEAASAVVAGAGSEPALAAPDPRARATGADSCAEPASASAAVPRRVVRFPAAGAEPAEMPEKTARCVALPSLAPLPADTPVRRVLAIEHSDAYYTRLTIHRIGSYAIIPLFVGEYVVGQRLLNQEPTPGGLKGLHAALAAGVVGVFGVNTVTGVWNLTEAWNDPGRTRRMLHVIAMLGSDAGFASTVFIRPHRRRVFTPGGVIRTFDSSRARTHRDLAIGSIALATAGTVMMWLWH